MSFLNALTQRAEERSDLMARMLARLDIDLGSVARDALGTRLRSIANTCRACRHAETCALWLDGKLAGSYRDFCPNAATFDAFRYQDALRASA